VQAWGALHRDEGACGAPDEAAITTLARIATATRKRRITQAARFSTDPGAERHRDITRAMQSCPVLDPTRRAVYRSEGAMGAAGTDRPRAASPPRACARRQHDAALAGPRVVGIPGRPIPTGSATPTR